MVIGMLKRRIFMSLCGVIICAISVGFFKHAALDEAKAAGIPVIACDRLLMDSDAVTYYATFNIEFITGDPGDNNINFFFDGAISVLQPHIDAGKLVALSGQYDKMTVATEGWATDKAQARFETILGTHYADQPLRAFLASRVVEMVDAICKGVEPPINDTTTYDNNVKVVPAFLCEPVAGTIDNYEELQIDSCYYTKADLGL